MRFHRWVPVALVLLLPQVAAAQDLFERETLPPEKTLIIYQTLLEPETQAETAESQQMPASPKSIAMTAERALDLLRERNISPRAIPGGWEFLHEGVQVFMLIDSPENRLRLVTPVARLDLLRRNPEFFEVELLQKMLKANYLATGYSRFCLNKRVVWVAFMHPLDSLTRRDLLDALDQLVTVALKTRETTG